MIKLQDQDIQQESCTLSCFIQPVKQKLFEFGFQSTHLPRPDCRNSSNDKRWTPVLSCKRLYGEPKFIMSLERKKARIISGIRDRQVQQCEKKWLGPAGGKVRNRNFKNLQNRVLNNSNFQMDYFVRENESKMQKSFEFKQKKNPYMNFSLMYIAEKKKDFESQKKTKTRASSAYYTNSHREKGSDNAYMHRIVCENHSKREKARPQTSCLSERNRNNERPKSQMS